jgi:hypothetical protein
MLLLFSRGLLAAPASDTPAASGLWKIDGDVQGRPVNMMCSLTEADHKLTGNCAGPIDNYAAHPITGKAKADSVDFYFQASFEGNPITLIVSGKLNEDRSQMTGDLDVEPIAAGGSFTGKREPIPSGGTTGGAATTAAPFPAAAAQSPVSGTWKVEVDVQGTAVSLTCALTESDNKLAGTCRSPEDDVPRKVSGTIAGDAVTWRFDAEYQGQPITVVMNSTLAAGGAKMSGTVAVAPMDADGTLTAVKQ